MKINIEMEDILDDCVENAIQQVKDKLLEYCQDNGLTSCDLEDINYSGELHEIIDSCVPIWDKQIKDTWYLHGNKLSLAYKHAGVGDNPMENNGMAAIYLYIDQEVNSWYWNNYNELFPKAA